MADEDNIQVGMGVDIRRAIQDITDFGKGVVKSVEEIREEISQRFSGDNLTGPMVANLGEGFDGVNVTINELIARLDDLRGYYADAAIGSEAQKRWGREIGVVEGQLRKQRDILQMNSKEINTSTVQSGAYRTAIMQGAFALQEINPQLGMFVHQLSPMITGMQRAAITGGGVKAMLSAVGASIMGPMGVAIGVGILSSVLVNLVRDGKEAREELSEFTLDMVLARTESEAWAESLRNIRSALAKLTDAELMEKIGRLKDQMKEINEEIGRGVSLQASSPKLLGFLQAIGVVGSQDELFNNLKQNGAVLNEALDQQKGIVDLVAKQKAEVERISKIEATTTEALISKNRDLKAAKEELNRLENLGIEKIKERTETEIIHYRTAEELWKHLQKMIVSGEKTRTELIEERARDLEKLSGSGKIISSTPGMSWGDMYISQANAEWMKEMTGQLKEQKTLWEDIGQSVGSVMSAQISGWSSSLNLISQNNSMIQQVINSLGRAIVQALILKAVTSALNFIPGLGSIIGGFASAATSGGGGGGGDRGIQLGGGNNLAFTSGMLNRNILYPIARPMVITVNGQIENRVIRLAVQKDLDFVIGES